MTRQCGECNLCCKLLPMKRDAYTPERVVAIANKMVGAGMATAESFDGMRREWDKPAGMPCKHQQHRKGCAIYDHRPFGCRFWNCRWLVNDDTADLRRPDRSRVVLDVLPDFITMQPHDGSAPTNIQVVQIWCDPKMPDAWRDPALLAYIERRAAEGIATMIRFGSRDAITVFAPALSVDGEWHEVHDGTVGPQHTGEMLIEGLTSTARNIKVG